MKNLQIWNFLQPTTVNVSAEASLTETCFYFPKEVQPSGKRGIPKMAPEPN